jgi:hypothetical protein
MLLTLNYKDMCIYQNQDISNVDLGTLAIFRISEQLPLKG